MRLMLRSFVGVVAFLAIACAKNVRDPYDPSNKPSGDEVPANSANEAPPPQIRKNVDKDEPKPAANDDADKDAKPDKTTSKKGDKKDEKKDEKKDGPRRATQAECDEALNQFLILSGFATLPADVISGAKKQALGRAGGGDPCKTLSHDDYVCMMGATTPDQWKGCQPRRTTK